MWGFRQLTCVMAGFAHSAEDLEEAPVACALLLAFVKHASRRLIPFLSHSLPKTCSEWCLWPRHSLHPVPYHLPIALPRRNNACSYFIGCSSLAPSSSWPAFHLLSWHLILLRVSAKTVYQSLVLPSLPVAEPFWDTSPYSLQPLASGVLQLVVCLVLCRPFPGYVCQPVLQSQFLKVAKMLLMC